METLIECGKEHSRNIFWPCHDEAIGVPRDEEKHLLDTLEISHDISKHKTQGARPGVTFVRSRKPGSDLIDFLHSEPGTERNARLKFIHVHSQDVSYETAILGISRQLLLGLFDEISANPWIFWLCRHRYRGYYHMKAQNGYADTYYFATNYAVYIWTFLPAQFYTRTLLLDRTEREHSFLYRAFEQYKLDVSQPYVPILAAVLEIFLNLDVTSSRHMQLMYRIEQSTGFTWRPKDISSVGVQIESLTDLSRRAAAHKSASLQVLRLHDHCLRALEAIDLSVRAEMRGTSVDLSGSDENMSLQRVSQAIDMLRMLSSSSVIQFNEILSRAEIQLNVTFALLTHEDAIANLKAAEASTAIAKSMYNDSFSMKTIAFMTMAFLPATFLATFFALPFLDWKQKTEVHMGAIQLYWIVAICGTALVFATWAVVTHWTAISQFMSARVLVHRDSSDVVGDEGSQSHSEDGPPIFKKSAQTAAPMTTFSQPLTSSHLATPARSASLMASRMSLQSTPSTVSLEHDLSHTAASLHSRTARPTSADLTP